MLLGLSDRTKQIQGIRPIDDHISKLKAKKTVFLKVVDISYSHFILTVIRIAIYKTQNIHFVGLSVWIFAPHYEERTYGIVDFWEHSSMEKM